MTTRFDIHYNAMLDMGQLRHFTATTQGDADKQDIISSRLKPYGVDEFKYGTMFHIDDSESRDITAFAPSTGTLDFAALTARSEIGDEFALAPRHYGQADMTRIINRALKGLGMVPLVDTSITTASSTTEYTLPSGVAPQHLQRVYVQTMTGDDDDNEWLEITDWYVAPGATYELMFRSQPYETRTLMLEYEGIHPVLAADSTAIKTTVDLNLIVSEVVYRAFLWKKRNGEKITDQLIDDLNASAEDLVLMRKLHPVMSKGKPFRPLLTNQEILTRRSNYGPWNPNA